MTTVRIGATEHPLADVQEHPGNYVRALERAKTTQGFAECGCVTRSPRPKLQIRHHGSIFLLARWPDQAHLHSKDCPFLQRKAASGRAGGSQDAFQLRDDHHNIRLDLAMRVSTRDQARPRERSATNASRSQRRSAGLLAFLEYAWEAAGLNVWVGGGHRNWSACWSQLTTEFADCKINGKAGDTYLHVMERWDPSRKADILAGLEAFHDRLSPMADESPRGILVGEIDSHGDSQYGGWVVLRQSRARYFMARALYERFKQSHALALSGVGSDDRRCIAVLAVEKSSKGYLTVVDLAAMLANRQFLPCDSSYEVQMADYLIAAGRSFQKPLRHVDRAAVHPDFVLTDTTPETVIEVLGMIGIATYEERLAEKRRHYETQQIPLIEWTPTAAPIASLMLPSPAAQ